jgi:hypothetical protein
MWLCYFCFLTWQTPIQNVLPPRRQWCSYCNNGNCWFILCYLRYIIYIDLVYHWFTSDKSENIIMPEPREKAASVIRLHIHICRCSPQSNHVRNTTSRRLGTNTQALERQHYHKPHEWWDTTPVVSPTKMRDLPADTGPKQFMRSRSHNGQAYQASPMRVCLFGLKWELLFRLGHCKHNQTQKLLLALGFYRPFSFAL